MKRVKSQIINILGFSLTVIMLYFIIRYIIDNIQAIFPIFSNFNLFTFIPGVFLIILYFLIRGIGFREILRIDGYNLSYLDSIFILSELRRYIPGNSTLLITKICRFKKFDDPTEKVNIILNSESFLIVISSSFLGLLFLNIPSNNNLGFSYPLTAWISVLLSMILTLVISIFLSRKFNIKNYINLILIYMLGWCFFGAGNFLIISSFVYIDPYFFLLLISISVVSWLFGYLVPVIPLGLGIRETIFAYGLKYFMPFGVALFLAVAIRILQILSEIAFLGFIYSLRYLIKKFRVSYHTLNNGQLHILITCIFSYIIYFTFITFSKHQNFFTGKFDLGNMDQTVWNTINGKIFLLTNNDGPGIISRLSIHSDFILILISPLYLIWNDPRMLLLLQTVILALGTVFIYLLGQKIIKNNNIALALSVSYLLNPFLQKQNLYDFHAVTFSTTFLLGSFLFLYIKKYKIFLIFAVLSALTKENIFIIVGLFGIYIFLRESEIINKTKEYIKNKDILKIKFIKFLLSYIKNKYSLVLVLSLLSFLSFYLLVSIFIPNARGNNHFALEYFSDYGDSPSKIIFNIFLEPQKTLSALFTIENFDYLKKIFLPLGFLSFLSPASLIFAVPDLLINLLSANKNLKSIDFHYAASIIPFVYISSIFGIKKILMYNFRFFNKTIIFYYVLFFAIFSTWAYGVLPGSQYPALEVFTLPKNNNRQIRNFLSGINPSFSVAATNNIGAHLSHRDYIYTIPNGMEKADVIVFLLNDEFAQPSLSAQEKMVEDLKKNKNYEEIYQVDKFIAFAKKDIAISYFNTVLRYHSF